MVFIYSIFSKEQTSVCVCVFMSLCSVHVETQRTWLVFVVVVVVVLIYFSDGFRACFLPHSLMSSLFPAAENPVNAKPLISEQDDEVGDIETV